MNLLASPSQQTSPPGVSFEAALAALAQRPREILLERWNWKSALLSSLIRGAIFFTVNLKSGWAAAWGAMMAEFALRALTAGFYGALTQSFRAVTPPWHAFVGTALMLPLFQHSLELLTHWLRQTPQLWPSIAASASFTLISTSFNLYAMRQGALVVGQEGRPLREDLARVPRIVVMYLLAIPLLVVRALSRRKPV